MQAITSVIQALSPENAIGPIEVSYGFALLTQGIVTPIIDQLDATVQSLDPERPLAQHIDALAACFKGLTPSEDDIFDADVDTTADDAQIRIVKMDPRLAHIRDRAERSIAGVVRVWTGDGEVADVSTSKIALTSVNIIPSQALYHI